MGSHHEPLEHGVPDDIVVGQMELDDGGLHILCVEVHSSIKGDR